MKIHQLDNGKTLLVLDPDAEYNVDEIHEVDKRPLGENPDKKKIILLLSGLDKIRVLGVFSKITDQQVIDYVFPDMKSIVTTPRKSAAFLKLKEIISKDNEYLDPLIAVSK